MEHIDSLALYWEDPLYEEDPGTLHLHHLFSQILLLPNLPTSLPPPHPFHPNFLSSQNRRVPSIKRLTYEAFDSLLSWFFFLTYCCSVAFQKLLHPRYDAYNWGWLQPKESWLYPLGMKSLVSPRQRWVQYKCAFLYKIVLK